MTNPSMPIEGQPAIDVEGVDTEGAHVRLYDLWRASTLVVVFLRHLGCTFCRTQVLELRRQYPSFRALGAEVVCVAMGSPHVGKAFKVVFDLPFRIVMVPENDLSAYKSYGLGRGTLRQLLGIRSWIKGLAALPKLGWRVVGQLIGDGTQLPGTFIIDTRGTIRLAYRSKDASDNPSNKLLLETLGELHKGGVQLEDNPSQREPEPAAQP